MSSKKNYYKEKMMRRKEEKKEEPETPKYRDRAKERREDQNPDYEPTELGSFHAVAPPGTDLRLADAQKISIEKSKYLGGDLEHTHLVKGLDYALLHKVRSENEKKPDAEDGKDAKSRATKEDQAVSFRTATAKSVYQWIIKPQSTIKANEMFLPGRMAFIYNMEDGLTNDIPTTLHRSKADCPIPEEMVTVSVDGSVLDRIAKIMSYLRLGSSGKVLKKKKKERDTKGKNNLASDNYDEAVRPAQTNGSALKHQLEKDMPPPPLPPRKNNFNGNEKQSVPIATADDDDIFVGDGVDYIVPNKEMSQSPVSEDMDESPHNHQKQSYFTEPVYGPVPPSEPAQAWQQSDGYEALQAQMVAAGHQGNWSGYQYAEQQLTYAEQYLQQSTQEYDVLADPSISQDPMFMTQADKDRGLGSVFKRDDQRLKQLREKDAREKDPNFISDSYSECYPGYQEYNNEIAGSDDEDDLSKMDMGGRAKGRLHRWDFETEEEWAKYNEQKEAMPKAAFQFGVKMQDGRKTRKTRPDQIACRRRGTGGEGRRDETMVKAVVGDEAHLKAFEDNLSSSAPPAQLGLVVGKLSASSARALVYSLLPTPPTDAGAPACSLRAPSGPKAKAKGGGKGGGAPSSDAPPSLEFDVDWVAEHARQVSRMLLGGMSVIGIYIWASEASFKATSPAVLAQVIRVVSRAVPCYGSGFDERLLIHISYSPRRWACRICEIASGSLRPCDFKYSKLLASLQTFRCTYNFEIRLTVVQTEPFNKVISKAISHLTKEVQNAKALIDGDLFSDDMNITSEGPHKIDFLVPFKNDLPAEECSLEGVAGLLLFAGSVSALSYLGPKESISEAISDLKVDIITSLRSRLDIILDEADDESTINDLENSPSQKATQVIFHELREPYSFSFPRRILIPWLSGSYVCDYLQQSETTEDAMERCKEVISLETDVESSSIIEPESAAASATLESFWDVVPGALSRAPAGPSLKDSHSGQMNDSRRTQGNSFNILAALFVLLVALLVGLIFTFSANSKT